MKFKVDENLPGDTCALFRDFGLDALSVGDQQLGVRTIPRSMRFASESAGS